jgi:PadR family transcriptional regulator PadR
MAGIEITTALLQALIRGPNYGIALSEQIRDMTKGKLSPSPAAVYAALRAMEDDGLVDAYLGDEPIAERGGRPRRYFKLNAEGRRAALEDRATVAGLFDLPLKVRAFVGRLLGSPEVAR